MSDQATSVLLDKNVIRHALTGIVKQTRGVPLQRPERLGLALLYTLHESRNRLFISSASQNVLARLYIPAEARALLATVSALTAGKYSRRWARRLRTFGFTREDASILSLGSFGVYGLPSALGANIIVTFDLPMIHNFTVRRSAIEKRFTAMTTRLPSPFSMARLPQLSSADEMLAADR